MYNRQLDSEMADTQVTQKGKTMDTVCHAKLETNTSFTILQVTGESVFM